MGNPGIFPNDKNILELDEKAQKFSENKEIISSGSQQKGNSNLEHLQVSVDVRKQSPLKRKTTLEFAQEYDHALNSGNSENKSQQSRERNRRNSAQSQRMSSNQEENSVSNQSKSKSSH